MMRPIVLPILIAVLAGGTVGVGSADAQQPTQERGAAAVLKEGRLRSGVLDNGLRYLVDTDSSATRGAIVLVLETGALNEGDTQLGAARIAAGLTAAGSVGIPQAAVGPLLAKSGVDPAANMRTTAGAEWTELVMATPKGADIGPALTYLASLLAPGGGPVVTEASVRQQVELLASSDAATQGFSQRISERLLPEIAPGTRFVERLPFGVSELPGLAGARQVRDYIADWYEPSGATVVITGDLDPQIAEALIQRIFGAIPQRQTPERQTPGDILTKGVQLLIDEDPEATEDILQLLTFHEAEPALVDDGALRSFIARELGFLALTNRIRHANAVESLRLRGAYALTISDRNPFGISMAVTAGERGSWRGGLTATLGALHTLRQGTPFTDDEMMAAACALPRNIRAMAEETRDPVARARWIWPSVIRGDRIGILDELVESAGEIARTITAQEATDALLANLDPKNMSVIIASAPGKAPTPEQVIKVMRACTALPPLPSPGPPELGALTKAPVAPRVDSVVGLSINPELGVTSATLDNGVVIHHMRSDARPGEFALTISIAGGRTQEPEALAGITKALSTIWVQPATAAHDSGEFASWLACRPLALSASIDLDTVRLTVSGPTAALEDALRLAQAFMLEARLDDRAYEAWTLGRSAGAAIGEQQAPARLVRLIAEHLAVVPSYRAAPIETLAENPISRAQAQSWVDRLLSQPIEVALVGDLDAGRAIEPLTVALSALPARSTPTARAGKGSAKHADAPKGASNAHAIAPIANGQAGIAIGCRIPGVLSDPESALALELAGPILDARLTARLRDELSIAGSLDIVVLTDTHDGIGPRIEIRAVVAPEHAARTAQLAREALRDLAESPPSVEELSSAKRTVTQRVAQRLASLEYLASVVSDTRRTSPSAQGVRLNPLNRLARIDAQFISDALRGSYSPERTFLFLVTPPQAEK